MKKILFDLTECQPHRGIKFHGGGIYGYIVFEHLIKADSKNIIAYIDDNKYIPEKILNLITEHNVRLISAEDHSLLSVFTNRICDMLYAPLYSPKYEELFAINVPIIVTIHGLRTLELGRDKYEHIYAKSIKGKIASFIKQTPYHNVLVNKYYKRYQKLFTYNQATIITVSNHSKYSIQTFYPSLNSNRIKVRYSPSTTESNLIPPRIQESKGYYLIISADRWLKNSYRVLLAFDCLYTNRLLNKKVYVVGLNESSAVMKRMKNKEMYRCFEYLSKIELETLYANAYAFVYPTLNEGFGYPPLESMKYGTPCITSPLSSIPEVCADAVMYANPYSHIEMANRILQMESMELYSIYSRKAIERYKIIEERQKTDLEKLIGDITSLLDSENENIY